MVKRRTDNSEKLIRFQLGLPLLENIVNISDREWFQSEPVQKFMHVYPANYRNQTRFVGGCVRNSLLNIPISDIDVASTFSPEFGMDLFKNAGYRVAPTGLQHGTFTVIIDTI